MNSSDLYTVYKTFNGPEKRAISKFLASPYLNQRQEVIDLWQYFLKNASAGRLALKKETVFGELFPGKPYDDALMRHIMSWLLKSIEQYLAYSKYTTTPINETLHLAQAYKNKKLEKLSHKAIKLAGKQLAKMKPGQEAFHFKFMLEYEKYELRENKKNNLDHNLSAMAKALDKHILISKLKQACILRSHQSLVKAEYDFSLVKLLLNYVEGSSYLEEPIIAAYYNCYLALTDNNEEAFQELKESLQKKQSTFSNDDIKMLYFYSINFCIRRLNTGGATYIREAFEMYRFGLKNDILTIEGVLRQVAYNNIVSIGLKLKEFEWLETFIQDYKPKLLPQHRESNYIYNLARLNFTQRKYGKAMKLLHQVDDRHLLLNLNAKVMLLKLYYELQEYDALSSLLASFKMMLTRKKLLSYHKTHYKNIIRFTSRLLNLKPRDQKAYDKLKTDISSAEVLQEKEWLLAQLELAR